ncbi:glycosyltransferase family 4 protein [Amycolatopsis sp. VS8301801F10]|uniref:glycosyltransferase family 4 protein n=1 Tax=Amycolatopsis sp. VS8301801F10 TaxID=2652442 RepID=UPI0038FBEB1A
MKIAHVVNVGFEAGGAERSVRLVSDGLRRRGHQVLVVATDHLLDDPAVSDREVFADVLVPAIRGGPAARVAGYFWHRPAYRRVTAALRSFRPDVVHLHTIGEFSPAVLSASAAYPRVLTVHGPEDWTGQLLSWNLRSRAEGRARLSTMDVARLAYLRFLQRPAYLRRLRTVDRILTPSRFLADAVRHDLPRTPIHVVPNGVPLPAASPVPDAPDALFVGRLEPVKGAHVLVAAFATVARRLPHARLTLAGDGAQRAALEKAVSEHGLADRVRFAGWLRGRELTEAYRAASVVAIPSVWPENFPTVALEALGVGRAVAATDVGGIPELVRAGHNGILVPPGEPRALADALTRLLGDPGLRRAMGARSAGLAACHRLGTFLDRLEQHYREVRA